MFANLKHNDRLQCAGFLALLVVVFASLSPHFVSFDNAANIITASAVMGLLALGATFVIGSGGIDLSSAATMALAGVITATVVQDYAALHPLLAVILAVATGAFVGSISGALINITGAPSFIITLGMMSVARALAYIISNGLPIYGLPDAVTVLGQGAWLGVAAPVWFLVCATVVCAAVLAFTRFGLWSLIMGDNPLAAAAMGVSLKAMRLKVFALAGALSGLAGFIFMARTNSGDPTAGQNYELIAITAVILGGANLFGGKATILGTVLGILCLGVLQNGLNLLAISTFYQVLFIGVVLLAAAFLRRGQRA